MIVAQHSVRCFFLPWLCSTLPLRILAFHQHCVCLYLSICIMQVYTEEEQFTNTCKILSHMHMQDNVKPKALTTLFATSCFHKRVYVKDHSAQA